MDWPNRHTRWNCIIVFADDAVSYIVRGREVGGRIFNPPDNPLMTQDFIQVKLGNNQPQVCNLKNAKNNNNIKKN